MNRPLNMEVAEQMSKIFLEVVVAPSYDADALALLSQKKNIRLLELKDIDVPQPAGAYDLKKVNGGLIVQTIDSELMPEELTVVTDTAPTAEQLEDLKFAWKVVKYVKSNGIAIAKNKQSVGIGPGQVNRVWAASRLPSMPQS